MLLNTDYREPNSGHYAHTRSIDRAKSRLRRIAAEIAILKGLPRMAIESHSGGADGRVTRIYEDYGFQVVGNDIAHGGIDACRFLRRYKDCHPGVIDIDPFGRPWDYLLSALDKTQGTVMLALTDGMARAAMYGGGYPTGCEVTNRFCSHLAYMQTWKNGTKRVSFMPGSNAEYEERHCQMVLYCAESCGRRVSRIAIDANEKRTVLYSVWICD